ncbi:gastrula zinc finger protein XlCGF57.1-like [Salvelinus namaycush]|uniref:Gastrula zinc finger protein XlCGF57.1-like n=1 Tax=Salvelinus namaycush TaxID=8040 RepID=A0A8U0QSN7_SALNM|nr:gastrula zinc finger protein XlCGF57.1-like [Salvelinus namaycush]
MPNCSQVKTLMRTTSKQLHFPETVSDSYSHQFFPCPHCTISFTDCYFLENHIKNKHQKQYLAMLKSQVSKSKRVYGPTHSCPHCSCMFHTPRQLDIHTCQAHPSARPQKPAPPRKTGRPHRVQEKFHTCPQCSRRFKYLGSLLKHCKSLHKMSIVLTDGNISCADCEKSFENFWSLGPYRCHEPEGSRPKDTKQMICLEVGFQCLDCGKILTTLTSLNTHMRIHTGEKPYVCKECGKRFSVTDTYRYHMLIYNGIKPFKCQDCGKDFKQKSLLRKHMTVHSGERKYSCSQCDRQFAYRESLKLHLRTHSGERPFKCTVCGKDFADKGYLKMHLKIHNNQKSYHCGVCRQKFIRIGVLNVHLRERPYHCTVCDKQFARLDHLKNHQRTHTGEKPNTCTECGKSFTQSGDLTKHKRIHTGERPFECSECHKRFICSGSLTLHMRTHTHRDVKPYSRQECGKSFYEQSCERPHENPQWEALCRSSLLYQLCSQVQPLQIPA